MKILNYTYSLRFLARSLHERIRFISRKECRDFEKHDKEKTGTGDIQ
ncbi:MAG: hypothetical protein J7K64_03885 [Bacteroidales bacterium]|nr:hypothetical protein [Bacteroidales bacterium]